MARKQTKNAPAATEDTQAAEEGAASVVTDATTDQTDVSDTAAAPGLPGAPSMDSTEPTIQAATSAAADATVTVLAPNASYKGIRLGVQFSAGRAVAPARLAGRFNAIGYTVTAAE